MAQDKREQSPVAQRKVLDEKSWTPDQRSSACPAEAPFASP